MRPNTLAKNPTEDCLSSSGYDAIQIMAQMQEDCYNPEEDISKGESECSLMKKIQDQSRAQPDSTYPTSLRNKRSV